MSRFQNKKLVFHLRNLDIKFYGKSQNEVRILDKYHGTANVKMTKRSGFLTNITVRENVTFFLGHDS